MATPIPENRARFTTDEVARATGGAVVLGRGGVHEGVVSDSRAVRPGCVFVALKGASFDGHAFVSAAVAAGVSAVVVERGRGAGVTGAAVVEVDDTLVAWGALARFHLERWRGAPCASGARRVVAITGSAGKTTTKELAAALLRTVAPCHATAGNLNNRIGVPAVVLALEDAHRFAVVEMGMSLPGEIAAVAAIAPPDVSIVTNVGVAHAEGVGGREGVLREKRAVFEALGPGGTAIVNRDDAWSLRALEGAHRGPSLGFGRERSADYRLVGRMPRGASGATVVLAVPEGRKLAVVLPLPGEAAAIDLAAALAAAEAASGVVLTAPVVDAALATVHLPGRAEIRTLGDGTLVVDDTYNANPSSVRAALASLGEIGSGRRVAILGEMKELGDLAAAEHESLGDAIASAGVALAIGCGGLVGLALARAAAVSSTPIEVVCATSTDDAAREASARVCAGDVVLVKGSRSVGAEKVVSELVRSRGEKSPESLPSSGKSASSEAE